MFESASRTLLEIAADPKHLGAQIGFVAVLHTWSQTLCLHPHLHCIVPGGGLSPDRQSWVASHPRFFLPIHVLWPVFRGKFLAGLKAAWEAGELRVPESLAEPSAFQALLDRLYGKSWVVYCQPPFGSPERVLGYLARYTHRVAISNGRLLRQEGDNVVFAYKDYTQGGEMREMSLPAEEFIRRFLLHILPERFIRIRYYGLLSPRRRERDLALCRRLLGCGPEALAEEPAVEETWSELLARLTGKDPSKCEGCGEGSLRWIKELAAEAVCAQAGRSP